jgi:hypothetical protein
LNIGKLQNLIVDINQNRAKNGISLSHLLKYKRGKMAKLEMSMEDIQRMMVARNIVEKFEEILEEEGFEFFIEGEHMFLRTMDDNNVYRLYDKSMGGSSTLSDSIVILPRTNDAQDLIPMKINGKDPKWK